MKQVPTALCEIYSTASNASINNYYTMAELFNDTLVTRLLK